MALLDSQNAMRLEALMASDNFESFVVFINALKQHIREQNVLYDDQWMSTRAMLQKEHQSMLLEQLIELMDQEVSGGIASLE